MNDTLFNIIFNGMFIIVPILVVIIFIFAIAQAISPKFRGKLMSRQIKAAKYMVDESKGDIKDISTELSNATKDGIKTTVRAIKEGLTEETIYCKHCGSEIDADSTFCKKCGKEQ